MKPPVIFHLCHCGHRDSTWDNCLWVLCLTYLDNFFVLKLLCARTHTSEMDIRCLLLLSTLVFESNQSLTKQGSQIQPDCLANKSRSLSEPELGSQAPAATPSFLQGCRGSELMLVLQANYFRKVPKIHTFSNCSQALLLGSKSEPLESLGWPRVWEVPP